MVAFSSTVTRGATLRVCRSIGITVADLYPNQHHHVQRNDAPPRPPSRRRLKATKKKPRRKKRTAELQTAPDAEVDWAAMTKRYEAALPKAKLLKLAKLLGVTAEALRQLHIGWYASKNCFTFPEFNADGEIIGISTRPADGGKKKVIGGSKRGLYLPPGWKDRKGPIFIVEGASDSAALISMGLAGVGRPSATGGADMLAELFVDVPPKLRHRGAGGARHEAGRPGWTRGSKANREEAKQLAGACCPLGFAA